jgi:hypothetical protein
MFGEVTTEPEVAVFITRAVHRVHNWEGESAVTPLHMKHETNVTDMVTCYMDVVV